MSHKFIEIIAFEFLKSKKGKKYAKCEVILSIKDQESGEVLPDGVGFAYIFEQKLIDKLSLGVFCAAFDVFVDYHADLCCQIIDLVPENEFSKIKSTLPRCELKLLRCIEESTSTGKSFIRSLMVYCPNDKEKIRSCNFVMFDDLDGDNILRDLKPGIYYADFDVRISTYGDDKGLLIPFISNILECKSSTNNNSNNDSFSRKTTNEQKDNNKHKNS